MKKIEPTTLTPLQEQQRLEKLLSDAYGRPLIVDDYEVSALGVFSGTAIDEADDEQEIAFRFDPAAEEIEFDGEQEPDLD